jgi:hypothetical protein
MHTNMPEYIYKCECGNECTVVERMVTDTEHKCYFCGAVMWRKPQAVTVHWDSGLPPSAGDFAPEIQNHLDNVEQIREETDEYYYERDN